ncbi:predicted protein [Verticillium alfalfae VaMs.102]|uniref:Predicted protein n=1 Tax=Verticillium alfalfae (strain VaMs.102 / ATCC MYA-4576 / FGSC 10136) TaxID=526221 RepID=C9S5I0_VERA1|nr:predicted protein [Verticillium alfalfae VaMs.102]EEY15057.1 predicted protein [Verticillium alfalfae VaMs.102]
MSTPSGFQKLMTKARNFVPFLPPLPISPRFAKEQDASPLYSQLPVEVRQMIWQSVFGEHHAVHIYLSRNRIRAKECTQVDLEDTSTWGPHYRGACSQPGTRSQCDHVSFLLTCKKIYFEWIYTLYRGTLFDFSQSPRSLPLLYNRLPTTHVACISHVNLTWDLYRTLYLESKNPGKDEVLWLRIWDALAAMEGLAWLKFALRLNPAAQAWEHEWTERESMILSSIKKVTRPSFFEVTLPFPAAASTQEETLPCTIIRGAYKW